MNKIIYLDAAATYQKPDCVIDAQLDFLRNHYANSGRGICSRAAYVDDMVARARARVATFMNADMGQIVWTAGTTASMNMVARMLHLNNDNRILVSDLDHHSARLPFVETGAQILVCPLDKNYNIDIENIPATDVFVITAMSNVLGRAQNVADIIRAARAKNPNVITVVDAAQLVVHEKIDVQLWGADFVCWSGHKIGADTGLGILYIKNPDRFAPVNFGGGMVNKIVGDNVVFNNAPDVFEAGTLPLTQIAGMLSAIDSLESKRPDLNLIKHMYDELQKDSRVRLLSSRDASLLTFVVDGMHALDFGALMGAHGICIRVGNMCASWVHQLLDVPASIRFSVGAYNTVDEIETALKVIKDILK